MNIRFLLLMTTVFFCMSCTGKRMSGEENPDLYIQRFDVDFFRYLQGELTEADMDNYSGFLKVYGEKVLNVGSIADSGFYTNLKTHFSNPALLDLYRTQQETSWDIPGLNAELSKTLDSFLKEFPDILKPKVYMHVSGWEQKVVVTDSILSLSTDYYLGSDFPYYQHYFPDYQRKQMHPGRMVPDYVLGFMMANIPFEGNEDVLLDRMLYEGKLAYLLSCFLPEREEWEYVAYSKDEYEWCTTNQKQIWKTIIENKHLFELNLRTTSQYLKEAPHTAFLPDHSPGRVGVWLGYQIISSYMKRNSNLSLKDLIERTNYQEILKESKYKP